MTATSPPIQAAEVSARVNTAIRVGMARANLSPAEIAEKLGMTYAAFWRRMSGNVSWNVDELAAAATALGVDVAELFRQD